MLYYCKTPKGNFGDDLNLWLWPRLAPEVCDEQDSTLFIGIGTILSHHIPPKPVKVVFGAGCGKTGPLPKIDDRWKIYCVRGPLTAARLNLDPALALVDPAILVRRFLNRPAGPKYPVSFMPHLQSMPHADWEALCARIGFHCIDPRAGVERVLMEIQKTELLRRRRCTERLSPMPCGCLGFRYACTAGLPSSNGRIGPNQSVCP